MTRPTFALSLVACVVAAGGVVAGPVYAKTHVVRPGHSIQHAINVASPGDTIVVKRGTYHEALLITKDGIRLIGNRAKLVPPATPPNSPCFEGSSFPGICVLGQGNPETNTVTQYVKNQRRSQ